MFDLIDKIANFFSDLFYSIEIPDFIKDIASYIVVFAWYPIYAIPLFLCIGITWFIFRKKITINYFDITILILPWLTWIGLLLFDDRGKSLSNIVEAIYLGLITGFLIFIRCLFKNKFGFFPSIIINILACSVAILLWKYVPCLPE